MSVTSWPVAISRRKLKDPLLKRILTFNPGWDQHTKKLPAFSDIRELQRQLKAQGLQLTTEADESTKGPASLTLADPDGNQILFDQHV